MVDEIEFDVEGITTLKLKHIDGGIHSGHIQIVVPIDEELLNQHYSFDHLDDPDHQPFRPPDGELPEEPEAFKLVREWNDKKDSTGFDFLRWGAEEVHVSIRPERKPQEVMANFLIELRKQDLMTKDELEANLAKMGMRFSSNEAAKPDRKREPE